MIAHYVDIIEFESSETVKSIDPYESERTAEKAERGLGYRLDRGRFYTQIRIDSAPELTAHEKAEVARFGIHNESPGLPEVTKGNQ